MSKSSQKGALILLILFFLIFAGFSVLGIYEKSLQAPLISNENVNHERFYDNKLWFYDESNQLIGTYPCEHSYCNVAKNYENDNEYQIQSYVGNEEELEVIQNRFVFIEDFDEANTHKAFLYDLVNQLSYRAVTYESVKNYGIGIANNMYITENENHKYGVTMVGNIISLPIKYQYDFIGLPNVTNEEGKVLSDYFIVSSNNTWFIIDNSEVPLITPINDVIVSFKGEYIIVKRADNEYYVMNYQGQTIYDEASSKLEFIDRYLAVYSEENEFFIYDFDSNSEISDIYSYSSRDVIETKINTQNELEIYINNEKKESISLN